MREYVAEDPVYFEGEYTGSDRIYVADSHRGLIVLGAGPGLLALVAGLQWSTVIILPGLTASGAALLFAVNAWCLDGKGMVWLETLPVSAADVFAARAAVIAECMIAVSSVTVLLAVVRNGLPPLVTGLSVLACWAVVVVQILAISMSWSVRSPYSARRASPGAARLAFRPGMAAPPAVQTKGAPFRAPFRVIPS